VPSAATARPAGPPAPASGPYWQGRPASSDAAVGQATQNSTYLGQRLQFANPEESFDPVTNPRYFISMMRQGFILGLTWTVLSSIFTPILFFIAIRSAASAAEASGNSGTAVLGALGFWVIVAGLIWLAFVLAFLLIPLPAQVSEWKFLVDDKGAARPIVFEHIIAAFRRRNTPVDGLGIRRLSIPGGVTRDYLEIKRGVFTGMISCFDEGNDLYVGWTFWLRMSPIRFILLRIQRMWHELTQKANELYITLRYESAKALREAMHGAAREGVDVATGLIEPEGHGIAATLIVSATELGR
jgi:hypothetical protein